MRSKATKESIGDFVQLVGVSADRPVIDRTGLTGDIDYDILISQQDARNQDDVNHAIIDAVTEQLGLELEPAKIRLSCWLSIGWRDPRRINNRLLEKN